jgi:hypothetical protein
LLIGLGFVCPRVSCFPAFCFSFSAFGDVTAEHNALEHIACMHIWRSWFGWRGEKDHGVLFGLAFCVVLLMLLLLVWQGPLAP